MQDVRSQAIGAGGGSGFFDSNGDRRLRPQQLHQNHQPLKCPRCDSLNTKFCYFNNYNLSQPRHFCKSCRRYWTKGGVLRNVPVGGGCRKSNRSVKLKTSSSDRKSNSHSSSEASSLTGTAATPEATSVSSSNSGSNLMNYSNSAAFFEFPPMIDTSSDDRIYHDGTGLTSLISSSNDPQLLGFKFNETDFPAYRMMQNHESSGSILYNHNSDRQLQEKIENPITSNELKTPEMDKAVVLETDLLGLNSRRNNGGGGDGAVELRWTAGEDEELFDQCYWTQWSGEATDHHHSMYLP